MVRAANRDQRVVGPKRFRKRRSTCIADLVEAEIELCRVGEQTL